MQRFRRTVLVARAWIKNNLKIDGLRRSKNLSWVRKSTDEIGRVVAYHLEENCDAESET